MCSRDTLRSTSLSFDTDQSDTHWLINKFHSKRFVNLLSFMLHINILMINIIWYDMLIIFIMFILKNWILFLCVSCGGSSQLIPDAWILGRSWMILLWTRTWPMREHSSLWVVIWYQFVIFFGGSLSPTQLLMSGYSCLRY